jgi:hypothetical protein
MGVKSLKTLEIYRNFERKNFAGPFKKPWRFPRWPPLLSVIILNTS